MGKKIEHKKWNNIKFISSLSQVIINLSHSDLCLKPAKIKSLNLKGAKMKSVLLVLLLLIFLLDQDISLHESQDDDNNNTKSLLLEEFEASANSLFSEFNTI